jgi:hypothetical protein
MDPDSDPGGLKTCGSVGSGSGTLREGILGHQFNKRPERLLLHAFHVPFFWRIKKNHTLLWFKKSLQKKSAKQENSSLFVKSNL